MEKKKNPVPGSEYIPWAYIFQLTGWAVFIILAIPGDIFIMAAGSFLLFVSGMVSSALLNAARSAGYRRKARILKVLYTLSRIIGVLVLIFCFAVSEYV